MIIQVKSDKGSLFDSDSRSRNARRMGRMVSNLE